MHCRRTFTNFPEGRRGGRWNCVMLAMIWFFICSQKTVYTSSSGLRPERECGPFLLVNETCPLNRQWSSRQAVPKRNLDSTRNLSPSLVAKFGELFPRIQQKKRKKKVLQSSPPKSRAPPSPHLGPQLFSVLTNTSHWIPTTPETCDATGCLLLLR